MNVQGVTVIVPAPVVVSVALPLAFILRVVLPAPFAVIVSAAGAQGPPGAAGAGYVYTQTIAALVWTVVHDLGFFPSVAVFSSGGVAVLADVAHLSLSTLTITFVIPFAGFARLS